MSGIEAYADRLAAGDVAGIAAFGIALVGGLVAGLGPCVLPMLPAVFGYITGTVAGHAAETDDGVAPLRALALTGAFVLGMSLVFTAIGVAAGAIGRALIVGSWAYYVVAGVCLVLGLHMLGLISLPVDRLNAPLPVQRPRRQGLIGALLFGMLFGLVASPCSTPILAAIATIAAATGDPARGGALLFVYGIGKGVPLLLLGVAAGSLGLMRRLSNAATVLTKVGGVGLLAAAAYLVWLA
jgi:cytochrome c-type biogenesis protein